MSEVSLAGFKVDGFVKSRRFLFLSFPPRIKCGINSGGNPVISNSSGLPPSRERQLWDFSIFRHSRESGNPVISTTSGCRIK
ncbi:MAG: hypothetical protein K9L59_18730, partial [Desulfobacterales bacterium]|nr:hypothetical protein [Desulfobacterales bacterium]